MRSGKSKVAERAVTRKPAAPALNRELGATTPRRNYSRAEKRNYSHDPGGGSHVPVYTSDEDDIEIQEAIFLSQNSSRPAASASSTRAFTAWETPYDRKGKRKLQSEDGPSNSKKKPSRSKHFDCAICFEKVHVAEKFLVSHCTHEFCNTCIGRYVAAKISENVAMIGCPDPGCKKGSVEIDLCCGIIPSKLFDRWSVALCEDVIGGDKLYCPFKDCSSLLINDGKEMIKETECPHCHRLFCARCCVPWHHGIKCKEFKRLGDDEKGHDDLKLKNLADKKKWQRCPKCKIYVSRKSGCLLIHCRCNQYFCYNCAAPMEKDVHYCDNCNH